MTRDEINSIIDETCPDEGVLLADGFEDAFIGAGCSFNTYFAVYDRSKCIEILMTRDKMDEEEAEEFFEFNVQGAYVGKNTPIFVKVLRRD
jgi:hypothetical protein